MAEDEARFGRVSIPRRAWAPPGVRPCAPQHIVREYTHVYAAVAPAHGQNDLAHSALCRYRDDESVFGTCI
jgi:hypothetical protein